jgi:hypothetical protein
MLIPYGSNVKKSSDLCLVSQATFIAIADSLLHMFRVVDKQANLASRLRLDYIAVRNAVHLPHLDLLSSNLFVAPAC